MSKYLNIHVLQSLPLNNVNRDDQGNVKTVSFGGALRQRVSSQCWKRAIKEYFSSVGIDSEKSSSLYPQIIYDRSVAKGASSKEAIEAISSIFSAKKKSLIDGWKEKGSVDDNYQSITKDGGKLKTKVQMFLSEKEVDLIVEAVIGGTSSTIEKIIGDGVERYGVIISLFGRMFADYETMDVNAASSFAHIFTTHECSQESDYFTLVDDLKGTKGAGHLNQKSYSTGTFYRHIVLNVTEFEKLLEGTGLSVKDNASKFVEACLKAFPTGSKNGMYANSVYDKVIVDVTESCPITMALAFETPIVSNDGYTEKSIDALKSYRDKTTYRGYDIVDSFESSDTQAGSFKSLISFINKVC